MQTHPHQSTTNPEVHYISNYTVPAQLDAFIYLIFAFPLGFPILVPVPANQWLTKKEQEHKKVGIFKYIYIASIFIFVWPHPHQKETRSNGTGCAGTTVCGGKGASGASFHSSEIDERLKYVQMGLLEATTHNAEF